MIPVVSVSILRLRRNRIREVEAVLVPPDEVIRAIEPDAGPTRPPREASQDGRPKARPRPAPRTRTQPAVRSKPSVEIPVQAETPPTETALPGSPPGATETATPARPAPEPPVPEPAAAKPTELQRQATAAEPVVAPTNEIVCEITFWRGYRKCAFFARAEVDGEEVAIAESPMFRARGNGMPERTEDALSAYEALVSQLERQGWNLADEGDLWFDQTFRMAEQSANEAGPD